MTCTQPLGPLNTLESVMRLSAVMVDGLIEARYCQLSYSMREGRRGNRRKVYVVALTSILGLTGGGFFVSSVSAATVDNAPAGFYGTCVGAQDGGPGSVACLNTRLTSTGVPEFKSVLSVNSNNAAALYILRASYASSTSTGWFWNGIYWVEQYSNPQVINAISQSFNYIANVPRGLYEQIVDSYPITFDFNVTY